MFLNLFVITRKVMSTFGFEEEFHFAVNAVMEVGKLINKAFHSPKTVTEKSSFNDLVTETDQLVEDTLKKCIKEKFPDSK